MEYLLVWYYDAGFRSGTETKGFNTLEEAKAYLEKNKRDMITPTLYHKMNL